MFVFVCCVEEVLKWEATCLLRARAWVGCVFDTLVGLWRAAAKDVEMTVRKVRVLAGTAANRQWLLLNVLGAVCRRRGNMQKLYIITRCWPRSLSHTSELGGEMEEVRRARSEAKRLRFPFVLRLHDININAAMVWLI